jgi:hypothetical protein
LRHIPAKYLPFLHYTTRRYATDAGVDRAPVINSYVQKYENLKM